MTLNLVSFRIGGNEKKSHNNMQSITNNPMQRASET